MEVPSKSVHKVTLVFLEHPHHSLQLSQSEDLRDGAPRLEGDSGPPQQTHTLERVRLQPGLPQPGPETESHSLLTLQGDENTLNPKSLTRPSAC